NDQSERPVTIVSISHRYDLALLRIMLPGEAPYLPIRNAETLVPGERIFAVGTSAGLQATITDGVFTGFRKLSENEEQVIQFSAPVNPGNSGGPLIDGEGKVLGVVNAKYLMKNGIPISGVGFAVPSGRLKEEYGTFLQ
ncbi:MAG: S1C family serine protease, partial [Desulfobacterales bacterium]|nr:S1C family serine protease [Desulfobacterales bacterium]